MTTQSHQLMFADTPNTRTQMLLDELERQVLELKAEIRHHEQVLRKRRQALCATRHLLGIYQPKRRAGVILERQVSPEELYGLSLEDAVYLIAERNHGIVRSTPANNLLREVGILPDDSRARTRLYHHLANSPRYENVERGMYRLIEDYEPESGLTDEQEELLERYRTGKSASSPPGLEVRSSA